MCKLRTENLLVVNGVLWAAVGTKILLTGVQSTVGVLRSGAPYWWQALVAAGVFAGFYAMFGKVVARYSARILSFPEERRSILHTFSVKGYILIAFMISLGITLRHVPWVGEDFFASFYPGLGGGLLSAGVRFFVRRASLHHPESDDRGDEREDEDKAPHSGGLPEH